MAWIKHATHRRSVTFRDSEQPNKRALDATIAPLHYESVLDSGEYDAAIDMTPQRVQTAALDGWRVTANSWHYGLGQRADGRDGWVGFGGRQGAHQFWFRFERFAWLRWSTRTVTNIGNLADYNRANLNQSVNTLTLNTTGEELPIENVATWSNVVSGVDIRWRADGNRLKEEIIVPQSVRDTLPATYPAGSPLTDTWLTARFRLDVSDLPRLYKAGVLQSLDGDFDDDDGTEPLVGRDALDRLLFLLPVDDAIVYDADGEEIARQRLRKRLYYDGTTVWLLVGIRADVLNSMPDGVLVFDPTIDDTPVGASADDAGEDDPGYSFSSTDTYHNVRSHSTADTIRHFGARFTDLTGLDGTVSTAYLQQYHYFGTPDVFGWTIVGHDVDSSPNFSDDADVSTRIDSYSTTAYVTVYESSPPSVPVWFGSSYEIKTIIQEIIDRASWDGDVITLFLRGDSSPVMSANTRVRTYDNSSSTAAQLYIEYTTGSSDLSVTVSDTATLSESRTVTVSDPARSISDSVTVTDAPTASIQEADPRTASVADTATLSESTTAAVSDPAASVADTATLTDEPTASLSTVGAIDASVADTLTLSESVIASHELDIELHELVLLLELTPAAVSDPAVSVDDTATVTDEPAASVSVVGELDASVADTVTVSESVSLSHDLAIEVNELALLIEVTTASLGEAGAADASVADTATLSESVTAAVSDPAIDVDDTATLSESVIADLVIAINVADAVTIGDSAAAGTALALQADETLTLTESVAAVNAALASAVADTATLTESVDYGFDVMNLATAETLSIAEVITMWLGVGTVPAARTLNIAAEDRTLDVPSENRVYNIDGGIG